MGSCTSFGQRRVKKELKAHKGEVLYLKNIDIAEVYRLKLSNQLLNEKISKAPEIDILKSDLYNRRIIQNQEKHRFT